MPILPQRRLLVKQPVRRVKITGKQRPPPWAPAALRLGYLAGRSAIKHETAAADGLLALPLDAAAGSPYAIGEWRQQLE